TMILSVFITVISGHDKPQPPGCLLDDKQQSALTKTERELALSRLKGEEKERVRLGYAADDLGFVGDSYQEARQRYIS
ncbi:phage tail tape measure protein, partial [Escherichia coli]